MRKKLLGTLTVKAARINKLKVYRYAGTPDDAPGTVIQNTGVAAAPYGPWGGVKPGHVGNLMITAHRSSHGAPMLRVPNLRPGNVIVFTATNGDIFKYRVAEELWINFRKAKDRRRQAAPVPGHLGQRATVPAITLSTCATPEDNALGLRWRDRLGNPTHRIAITGYLINSPDATAIR